MGYLGYHSIEHELWSLIPTCGLEMAEYLQLGIFFEDLSRIFLRWNVLYYPCKPSVGQLPGWTGLSKPSSGLVLEPELELEPSPIYRTGWNWNWIMGAGYGTGLEPPLVMVLEVMRTRPGVLVPNSFENWNRSENWNWPTLPQCPSSYSVVPHMILSFSPYNCKTWVLWELGHLV